MDGQEALTVLVCATACAAIGVIVVVSVGLMLSPDDLAVFSKVKGVTTITLAGRAAILMVSAIGAGVGAQIGIAVRTRSSMEKTCATWRIPASNRRSASVPNDASSSSPGGSNLGEWPFLAPAG